MSNDFSYKKIQKIYNDSKAKLTNERSFNHNSKNIGDSVKYDKQFEGEKSQKFIATQNNSMTKDNHCYQSDLGKFSFL